MTLLVTWADTDPDTALVQTTDTDEIIRQLDKIGIAFDQWDAAADLAPGASTDDVLAAYRDQVDKLIADHGFTVVDVAQLQPSDEPSWPDVAAGARAKFLEEHTHGEDEVRFFVRGSGVFYLHLDGHVHAVRCEAGDLLSVPALTTHWFDMGTAPNFAAIRFFLNEDGWVGEFTGDPLASRFADFDTLATWS